MSGSEADDWLLAKDPSECVFSSAPVSADQGPTGAREGYRDVADDSLA